MGSGNPSDNASGGFCPLARALSAATAATLMETKASAQKNPSLCPWRKATLDRAVEDVVKTGCLLGRQPLHRLIDWRGIPAAIKL
jgi:hypothetical protein